MDAQALKYIINEQRPANARKADPGMPSSHANSESGRGVTCTCTHDRPKPLPPTCNQLMLDPCRTFSTTDR
mgnify:CR=1 FL=1